MKQQKGNVIQISVTRATGIFFSDLYLPHQCAETGLFKARTDPRSLSGGLFLTIMENYHELAAIGRCGRVLQPCCQVLSLSREPWADSSCSFWR